MMRLRVRLVRFLLHAGCRHPEGVICEHRQFEYDEWCRGYGKGFHAGKANMEAKWRGNLSHEGPYADYPPPQMPPKPEGNGMSERLAAALWSGVQRGEAHECWEWMGSTDRKGYGRVWVSGFGQFRTHRLAYQLAIGPISPGLYVCHRCDNPPCCNPDHLWMGTIRDNTRDMDEKGRRPLGERSVHSRLTVEQVREMRALHGTLSGREIARRYGVAQSTAMALLHRRTWTHV